MPLDGVDGPACGDSSSGSVSLPLPLCFLDDDDEEERDSGSTSSTFTRITSATGSGFLDGEAPTFTPMSITSFLKHGASIVNSIRPFLNSSSDSTPSGNSIAFG